MNYKTAAKFAITGCILSASMTTSAIAAEDGAALYASKFCVTCHGVKVKNQLMLPTQN